MLPGHPVTAISADQQSLSMTLDNVEINQSSKPVDENHSSQVSERDDLYNTGPMQEL